MSISDEMMFRQEAMWGPDRLGNMPKVTQLDSGIAGIRTQISLTLKSVPTLSTVVCFRQNKIIAEDIHTAVVKQEGVLYYSKEGWVIHGSCYRVSIAGKWVGRIHGGSAPSPSKMQHFHARSLSYSRNGLWLVLFMASTLVPFYLIVVQLLSRVQHYNSKASVLQRKAFLMVQLSHPYPTRWSIHCTIIYWAPKRCQAQWKNTGCCLQRESGFSFGKFLGL